MFGSMIKSNLQCTCIYAGDDIFRTKHIGGKRSKTILQNIISSADNGHYSGKIRHFFCSVLSGSIPFFQCVSFF